MCEYLPHICARSNWWQSMCTDEHSVECTRNKAYTSIVIQCSARVKLQEDRRVRLFVQPLRTADHEPRNSGNLKELPGDILMAIFWRCYSGDALTMLF